MQSETGSSIPTEAPLSNGTPTAREILSRLKDAESPLDFIKNNLRVEGVENRLEPTQVIAEVEAQRSAATIATLPENPSEIQSKEETKPQDENVKNEQGSGSEDTETSVLPRTETGEVALDSASEDNGEVSLSNKEENFKNLRRKVAEVTNTLKEKETALEELSTKLKKIETGEELPEVLAQSKERIAELEKYERLHALKLSPAYKEAYIKPLDNIRSKLSEIAADYDIPNDVINEAVNITNRRELNAFLADHFDDVGALEVKDLVTKAHTLLENAREAEKEPAKALQSIEQDYEKRLQARRQESNNAIIETSKEGWVESLTQIRNEGKIAELIAKETDIEYNKTIVEPVLNAAASEYGKLVKMLVDNGLEKLPKDLGFALARMVHLAHASAISIESRTKAEREAAELRKNTERTTNYLRPQIGSSGIGGTGGGGNGTVPPRNPTEAADAILSKVLSRR